MSRHDDPTGEKRLLRNLLSGWAAHLLQIVSGFILPRLVSDRLGQDALGVWDFGWAVVSYFSLLQGGIVSSVNRYVARHRSVGDTAGLNVAVNSVGAVLKAIAGLIAVLSVAVAWAVPYFMGDKLAGLTTDARWVVLLLGLTAAVQVQGAVYGGVLTGCHCWTIQNGIKTVAAILSVCAGVSVLLAGGTIAWLAGVMLASELILRSAQRWFAGRVCPELEISTRHFSRRQAWEMSRFGGKSYVNVIAQMMINQTSSIIVASTFGVGALAVFARPRTLLRAFSSVVENNALVMVPTVSALEADGKSAEIGRFAVAAARYAVFVCLPALFFLLTLGGDLIQLWMGDRYVDRVLLGTFAVAGLLQAMYIPLFRVLMGMNRHGRLGLMNLGSAVATVILVLLTAVVFKGGLRWIAVAISIPSVVVNAFILPVLVARCLHLPVTRMLVEIWTRPFWCALPSGLGFLLVAVFVPGGCIVRLAAGAAAGLLLSGWLYWRHMIPDKVKLGLRRRLRRRAHSAPSAAEPAEVGAVAAEASEAKRVGAL